MPVSESDDFIQAYNAQAAVDSVYQFIIAAEIINHPTDRGQVKPLMEKVKEITGELPSQINRSHKLVYCLSNNLQGSFDLIPYLVSKVV